MQKTIPIEKAPTQFIILLICAGIIGASSVAISSKIISIFGITFSASVITYAFFFFIIDCIDELFGDKITKKVLLTLLGGTILVSLIYSLVVLLPYPNTFQNQQAFEKVFGVSTRIAIAGFLGFITSQFLNIKIFNTLKKLTNGKHLWLRNNLSTMTSTLLDSLIFITIAFWGTSNISNLILGEYTVKLIIALLDTFLIYGFVYYTRKKIFKKRNHVL